MPSFLLLTLIKQLNQNDGYCLNQILVDKILL
jgi:hypothetical protein